LEGACQRSVKNQPGIIEIKGLKATFKKAKQLHPEQLGTKVEISAQHEACGMLEWNIGMVFLTAIEENAIARFDSQSR
jgi:hypothetical protein